MLLFILRTSFNSSLRNPKLLAHIDLCYQKTPVLELLFNVLSCQYCEIFKNTYFKEHLRTAGAVLLIIKLLIKYWVSAADFFLIKNITWNGSYYKGL